MFLALLLALTTGSYLGPPTWNPIPDDVATLTKFIDQLRQLPKYLQPDDEHEMNCFWANYLNSVGEFFAKDPASKATGDYLIGHSRDRLNNDQRCKDQRLRTKIGLAFKVVSAKRQGGRGRAREQLPDGVVDAPFQLPPLPDRAGGDLGDPLLPMFLTLEARLAAGGHILDDGGRACAWASSALAAAQAVQRTPGATDGIAAGARTLEAQQATRCQGSALAQKEAAWAWIRANPGATQPLVVPLRPATAGPVLGPADGALWLATALLVLAPEAWPAFLVLAPAGR